MALKLKPMITKNIGARHSCKDIADIGVPGPETQNKTKNGYGLKTKMDAGQGKSNLNLWGFDVQEYLKSALFVSRTHYVLKW